MTETVDQTLERFGQDIAVSNAAGTTTGKGFLQPKLELGKTVPFEQTSLGSVDNRRWTLLTRIAVKELDTVAEGEHRFTVLNCRPIYLSSECSHWWATLEQQREAGE